jgi:L-asparaginase II
MSDNAPERIWAFHAPEIAEDNCGATVVAHVDEQHGGQEYVLADIHDAALARVKALETALEKCGAEIAIPHSGLGNGMAHLNAMYHLWRKLACARADIARAALAKP